MGIDIPDLKNYETLEDALAQARAKFGEWRQRGRSHPRHRSATAKENAVRAFLAAR